MKQFVPGVEIQGQIFSDLFSGCFQVDQSDQIDRVVFKTLKPLFYHDFSKKLVGRSGWFGREIRMVWSGDPDGFVFKPKQIPCKALKPFLRGNFFENKNQIVLKTKTTLKTR